MHNHSLIQRLLLMFLGLGISLSVGAFITLSLLNATVFDRGFVTEIVGSRAAYDAFGSAFAEGLKAETPEVNVEELESTLTTHIDYADFQASAGDLVGSAFDWLSGVSNEIDFSIQLTSTQAEFRTFIEDLLITRLEALPECQTAEEGRLIYEDPFEAACRPADFNAQEARTLFSDVPDNQFSDLYNNARITDENLNIDEQQIEQVPRAYSLLQSLPWVFIALAALSAVAAAFILKSKSAISMFVGKNLMRPSIGVLIIGVLVFGLLRVPSRLAGAAPNTTDLTAAQELARIFEGRLVELTLLYAGTVFVIGLVLYIVGRRVSVEPIGKPDHAQAETRPADFTAEPADPTDHTSQTS